jgi:hypothetical protein
MKNAMILARRDKVQDVPPLFLGQRWIQQTLSKYRQGDCTLARLGSKRLVFEEKQFAAALMHLYMGGFSLAKMAAMTSISVAELNFLRTQIDFMMLVDAAKTSFSKYFRDKLLLNEYPVAGYASIAAEYTFLEEIVRNQIRCPLIRRLMDQAKIISEKNIYSLPIDRCHLRDFKKLYSFFFFEQALLPNMGTDLFRPYTIIAREMVWRPLEEDYYALELFLSDGLSQHRIREELKLRLSNTGPPDPAAQRQDL